MMRPLELEQKYTVYVDLDGILVDFIKAAHELLGQPLSADNKKIFWQTVKNMGDQKLVEFWANMDWTSQGKELWQYVSNYSPRILSSPGTSMRDLIETAKTKWI